MSAGKVTLGIRPEDLLLGSSLNESQAPGEPLTGRVLLVERLGGTSHVHFDLGESGSRMMAALSNDRPPEVGEAITVRFDPARAHLFAADGKSL